MRTLTSAEDVWLRRLGESLRRWRLARNETQQVAASRLGVSLSTWRRMEAGVPTIPITAWLRAIELFGGGLDRLEPLVRETGSRFDQLEREQSLRRRAGPPRRRASRVDRGGIEP